MAESLRELYPDWERFAAVRARFDPAGRFANAYINRVLGTLRTPPTPEAPLTEPASLRGE